MLTALLDRQPKHQFRRALVTGASRGIGAALARALPIETDLLITARNGADLAALAEGLAAPGRTIDTVVADLASQDGRTAVIEAALRCDVDLIVNNAGLGHYGAFLERASQEHETTIVVNAIAPVALASALLPHMIEVAERRGQTCGLINVSSSAAFAPVPNFAVYAASKAFILSWTEALSAELADRPIAILAFCPGAVRTSFGVSAGYQGGEMPGALDPDRAARAAVATLGRQRTLVLDPIAALPLSAAALGRAAFAEAIQRGMRRFQR